MARPVYLYTGPEAGEKNDAISGIKSSLAKKYGDVDEYLFYASETPVQEFLSPLDSDSLFSNASCVVVKSVESIKKADELDYLAKWINTEGPANSVLILVSDEYSVNTKIEKALSPSNKRIFFELSESQRSSWIHKYFSANGMQIDPDAVSMILEMTESNTEALKNECRRFLILFEKGKTITTDDVDAILLSNREEDGFSLFDAMTRTKEGIPACLEHSLEILQKVRLSKENSSVKILSALSYCFRMLINYHKLKDASLTNDFNLKKNGFSSKKNQALYARASNVWTSGQCQGVLAAISKTDMDIRRSGNAGGFSLEDTCLQKLIYEIVTKKGGSSATYEDF